MELKEDAEILLFVHDKGEEFFLHYETWNIIPSSYHVKTEEYVVDMVMTKELHKKNRNCRYGAYNYFGKF